MSEINIKECPFCGGNGKLNLSSSSLLSSKDYRETRYCVRCDICGVQTPDYSNKKEAIYTWNQRYGNLKLVSKWEICGDGYYPYCSHCKQESPGRIMTDYCPNCGAKIQNPTDIGVK